MARGNVSLTKSRKAGVIFSIARIQYNLRKGYYAERIGIGAAVYLAGVLEYLTTELINAAREKIKHGRRRIKPRDILLGIKTDSELNQLLDHVQISEGGVLYILTRVIGATHAEDVTRVEDATRGEDATRVEGAIREEDDTRRVDIQEEMGREQMVGNDQSDARNGEVKMKD